MFLEFADDSVFVRRGEGRGVQDLIQFGILFEDVGEGEDGFGDRFERGGFGCGGVLGVGGEKMLVGWSKRLF